MNAIVRGLVLLGMGVLVSGSTVAQAGMLFDFDVVVANHHFSGGEIYGRTLVTGNATGNGGTVGVRLDRNPNHDTYTVAGNLNAGLNVQQGSVRVGGNISNNYLNLNGGGTIKSLAGFDALDLTDPQTTQTALQSASQYFAGLSPSSTYTIQNNTFTFSAVPGADGVAVFNVDIAALNNRNFNYVLDLGGASSVVINLTGEGVLNQLGNFDSSFRNNASGILWNFGSAKDAITTIDREWYGSILMPSGNLANQSPINGGVYVGGNFNQAADVRQVGYGGPAVPPPTKTPDVSTPPDLAMPPDFGKPPVVALPPATGNLPGSDDAPDLTTVPEPATVFVFALGGLIFAGQQYRKRRQLNNAAMLAA